MRLALVVSLLLAVVAVVFALQNPQAMEVNLLFVETRGSTALVLILTFAIGVVVGLLSTLPGRIRDKRTIKKLEKGSSSGSSSFTMPKAGETSPSAVRSERSGGSSS